MNTIRTTAAGERILDCEPEGPPVDALTLIGDALGAAAQTVVVPVARLMPAFFDLKTGVAGELTQKFVNYGLRLIVVGDIEAHVAKSNALRDFVYEANKGRQLWFVADRAVLEERLARDGR